MAACAALGDAGGGAGGGFGVYVKDGDGGALCGEFAGGSFADAHRAAGHDGDLIFEFTIHEIDFRVNLSSPITISAAWLWRRAFWDPESTTPSPDAWRVRGIARACRDQATLPGRVP